MKEFGIENIQCETCGTIIIITPDPWDHISPEYREGVRYTLHVDSHGKWYISNDLLCSVNAFSAFCGEMCDLARDGESKTAVNGEWK